MIGSRVVPLLVRFEYESRACSRCSSRVALLCFTKSLGLVSDIS